jgi:hypothetical protein
VSVVGVVLVAIATCLGMLLGSGMLLSQPIMFAAQLGLAAALGLLVLMVIVELGRSLADRWRRFFSRPY